MQFTTTHIKQVITYPFQDTRWQSKFLIGILVTLANFLIPVIPTLILYGYLYQIMHRILVGDGELHLPEWSDFGKLIEDGWRLFCVYFIYMLPAFLFFIAGIVSYFCGIFGMTLMAQESNDSSFILIFYGFMGILMITVGIGMILSICASLALPPAICNTVKKNTFKAAFRFSEWWPVFKANLSGFVIALIIVYGLYMIIMLISQLLYMTMICCCLMYVVSIVGVYYISLVVAGLIPLVYKEGLEKLAQKAG
jgi:hypothetical protein